MAASVAFSSAWSQLSDSELYVGLLSIIFSFKIIIFYINLCVQYCPQTASRSALIFFFLLPLIFNVLYNLGPESYGFENAFISLILRPCCVAVQRISTQTPSAPAMRTPLTQFWTNLPQRWLWPGESWSTAPDKHTHTHALFLLTTFLSTSVGQNILDQLWRSDYDSQAFPPRWWPGL